jgi:hypothetical protein
MQIEKCFEMMHKMRWPRPKASNKIHPLKGTCQEKKHPHRKKVSFFRLKEIPATNSPYDAAVSFSFGVSLYCTSHPSGLRSG